MSSEIGREKKQRSKNQQTEYHGTYRPEEPKLNHTHYPVMTASLAKQSMFRDWLK